MLLLGIPAKIALAGRRFGIPLRGRKLAGPRFLNYRDRQLAESSIECAASAAAVAYPAPDVALLAALVDAFADRDIFGRAPLCSAAPTLSP
jgi:hypothetical protein